VRWGNGVEVVLDGNPRQAREDVAQVGQWRPDDLRTCLNPVASAILE
jgi:hypothetical protein